MVRVNFSKKLFVLVKHFSERGSIVCFSEGKVAFYYVVFAVWSFWHVGPNNVLGLAESIDELNVELHRALID